MKAFTLALSLLIAFAAAANEFPVSSLNNHEETSLIQDFEAEPSLRHGRRLQTGPNAAQRKTTWTNAHNDMREKYQVEFGGEYVPLTWNTELKAEAEAFAKTLVSTCVNRRPKAAENPNDYGVNSAMRAQTRDFLSPVKVMSMWENKLGLGWPKNGVFTQVLWSKTQYFACADASSPLENEKKCTASVCFYAKAGNCAFGRFDGDYEQAVISGPACSTTCPSNVEC